MGENVRLAIIGLGAMGSEVLTVAAQHPQIEVVCAVDPSETARATAAQNHPDLQLFAEASSALPLVDAVYIATPPRFHAALTQEAIAAGKHVFCEKPLSATAEDAHSMLLAAETPGIATGVNFALSDRSAIVELERAVSHGELGEIRQATISLVFPQWPREFQKDALWLNSADQGGFTREVLSHFVYVVQRVLGELKLTFAQTVYPESGAAEQQISAVIEAGDTPIVVTGVSGVADQETYLLTLQGTKKSYRLSQWQKLEEFDGAAWHPVDIPATGNEASRLSLFVDAVKAAQTGDSPEARSANLASFEQAAGVQTIVEQILASGR